jgi:hypothetical protein
MAVLEELTTEALTHLADREALVAQELQEH